MRTVYKSIQIFENPILEKFTHVHPLVPLFVWGPFVVWLLWRSLGNSTLGALGLLGTALGGLLVWTFTEYVLHRFVFHFPARGERQKRIQFIIHGLHHADPMDPSRLVMPPSLGVILAVIFYFPFRMLLGPDWVEPFFAFFLVGYLCYDYIHYYVHHFTPRTSVGRFLKQSHMIHHYKNHHLHWGVSSPLWDYLLGTYRDSYRT